MRIGIIREGKLPPDSRVALTPEQCSAFMQKYPGTSIVVQPAENRCFKDAEYVAQQIELNEDLNDCDVLLGIKEVPLENLIENKTYLFFSHTIKAQPYNRGLLKEVLNKKIRLIDYECLLDEYGKRVIAFGHFAGIVGAHNGLMAFGQKTGTFQLKRAYTFSDLNALYKAYASITLPPMKIVITGTGRVAKGVLEVMHRLNIKEVSPSDFLNKAYNKAVFTNLTVADMYQRKNGLQKPVDDFFLYPEAYQSKFLPYTQAADLMINAIYWDPKAPVFFTKEQMKHQDYRIKVIADITCDIDGSVPATIRPSTIEEPVYGFDPQKGIETAPFGSNTIDIMAVDNLPNELPRDASSSFGEAMVKYVLPPLVTAKPSVMIEQATIARKGKLTPRFDYLSDFVQNSEVKS